ncbi:sigma 54-interacting transcriptional regulator [Desulfobaculum bizertense]|uniref:sigma-54 interaction domain-containing protein n=1 Tax=Desulfobaculum bizertense TaxID=376490 RepID=UPI001F42204E|nr:sigma 54-interacting transcriptional regulator [Desulfobaculum bizertense]UIJ37046.1 sigma 54-interacting transcriptional regulator [Desulfobaculum bizertense]
MLDYLGLFTDIKHLIEFQRKIIDACADALMVVDKEGRIVYTNSSFQETHNVDESVLSKHVTEVIDNTRMHIVAQTGISEHDQFQTIAGRACVVSRIPITSNNETVGAVGMIRFHNVEEVKALTQKVSILQSKLSRLKAARKNRCRTEYTFEDIIGVSHGIREAKITAMQAAKTDATVLLRGESGVGKEVFAQSIHSHSPRKDSPFVSLNCSAIQETLIESELFGYEDGAFTGARKGGRKGKFELAHGGTIFLDEIGDMPLSAQVKLLRVLQEGEVDRLGSENSFKVDVRIISATNRDLEKMVTDGSFREDLFYRLNVIPIHLPPLRHTPEEIPRLAKNIWGKLARRLGIFHKNLSPQAIMALQQHSWKGNVRELKNVLERAMVMIRRDSVTGADIQHIILGTYSRGGFYEQRTQKKPVTLSELVAQTEKRAITFALTSAKGNRSQAARILGISRPLLYKKIDRYKIRIRVGESVQMESRVPAEATICTD